MTTLDDWLKETFTAEEIIKINSVAQRRVNAWKKGISLVGGYRTKSRRVSNPRMTYKVPRKPHNKRE